MASGLAGSIFGVAFNMTSRNANRIFVILASFNKWGTPLCGFGFGVEATVHDPQAPSAGHRGVRTGRSSATTSLWVRAPPSQQAPQARWSWVKPLAQTASEVERPPAAAGLDRGGPSERP